MLIGYTSFVILFIVVLAAISKSRFFKIDNWSRKPVHFAFLIKFFAACCLWLVYTKFYTVRADADIFKYFDDAAYLYEATTGDFLTRWKIIAGLQNDDSIRSLLSGTLHWDRESTLFFNDNRSLTRIHLFLYYFSDGLYFFHLLFFSFLSLIGSMALFRFFKLFSNAPSYLLFTVSFLLPSVLFWSSAPLKETFLLFGLGLFLMSFGQLKLQQGFRIFLLLFFSTLILVSIKVYFLLCMIPALIFLLITYFRKSTSVVLTFLFVHLAFFLIGLLFHEQIVQLIAEKQESFLSLIETEEVNSAISAISFSNLREMLLSIPNALFNVFLRPVWPPTWSIFSIFTSIEHILYIGLSALPFFMFRKPGKQEKILFLFCISSVFICATLIGLTTPIIGAIVRYKAPLLPFYLVMIFTFVRFPKLKHHPK